MRRTLLVAGLFLAALVTVSILVAQFWIGLGSVDMGWAGIAAMIGGLAAAAGLGMGLMVLVFYSDRSGHDRTLNSSSDERNNPEI